MAEAVWIIIFIPVVMWILSSLIKGGMDDEKPQPGNARKQASANDLDRFLEEVNRRRREAANRETRPPEQVAQVRRGPTPTMRSAPAPAPAPARPAPVQARPVPKTVVQPAAPRPIPVRPAPEIATVIPVEEILPVVPVVPKAGPRRPAVPKLGDLRAIKGQRKSSPAVEQLMPMLRSAEGLRTAFLVREIFGEPRCKRRSQ
ncbi:MAG: hypothetical protein AB7K24_19630 [Gemmataceae bacterium]